MQEVNLMIYTLSTLVAFLTLVLFTQKVRRRKYKRVDPWQTHAPAPRNKTYAKERITQPRVMPPPHLFRQR